MRAANKRGENRSIGHRGRRLTFERLEDRRLLVANLLFDETQIVSHGVGQDLVGDVDVSADRSEIQLRGNLWKAVPLDYEVTQYTTLEVTFSTSHLGELHAIGLIDGDPRSFIASDKLLVFAGTQSFYGIRDFQTYAGGEQRFRIPIGNYFTGHASHLVLGTDQDVAPFDAVSVFRDLQLYDTIPLDHHPIVSYGGGLDQGDAEVRADGTLELSGAASKAMLYSYPVSPHTMLRFDFRSSSTDAPQGIGWDTDLATGANWFQLTGPAAGGILDYRYDNTTSGATSGSAGTQTFEIPLGQYTSGDLRYLTFLNSDGVSGDFSNIMLYEPDATLAVHSYGGAAQDVAGTANVGADGDGLTLAGNTWKAIDFSYQVTPQTVVEFDFAAPVIGELQGIGFDTDLSLDSDRFFVLAGTQTFFGNRDYLGGDVSATRRYRIPLGHYYQGPISKLTFGNDDDVANPISQSWFGNVRVYEADAADQADHWDYDVIVYGGTPGGVAAAVEAARLGKSVALIEPSVRVGGVSASGLGMADVGHIGSLGGVAEEFFQRVHDVYSEPEAWTQQDAGDYTWFNPSADKQYRFEPHVAEQVFGDMLDEELVAVITRERLDRSPGGVHVADLAIQSLDLESGGTFEGLQFVDSSYEGDLMAAAGVTYTVQRESNAQYGESLNGINYTAPYTFIPPNPIDAYVVPGDPESGLIRGVQPALTSDVGDASDHLQAYNFRLTLTNDPDNMIPFRRPDGYDEADYELLFRYYEAGNRIGPFSFHLMPNLKTDSNGAAMISTDLKTANWEYPEASYERREEIIAEYRKYTEGLLWTLQNHPRIPAFAHTMVAGWGFAADEYPENDGFPTQIYVREARRMVSDYVTTENDARHLTTIDDPIAIPSYPLDSHYTGLHVGENGEVIGEGSFYYTTTGPFYLSYRSIVPRRGEVTNLAVTSAVSASHVAYGSIRMEPVYMMIGHSAGAAAAQAIDSHVAMQDVNYANLRAQLAADGLTFQLPSTTQTRDYYTADTLPGIVIDDHDATFQGKVDWGISAWPWVNGMYTTDRRAAKGDWSATFATEVHGAFEVRVLFPTSAANANNVPVTVHHAGGATTLSIDQTTTGNYVSLGTFLFDGEARIVLDNTGTHGLVIADAVQLLPDAAWP
ncbi:MAG: FAD-dependent oxidoreductase [Planctomycetales bacterium]|nr:FAD-dependent oxidoreductase [Planctomycetales bacterium]